MKLLVFAHYLEAEVFIEQLKLSASAENGVFYNQNYYLLITGEGPFSALHRTSWFLGQRPEITEIINLGIVGTLQDSFAIGAIYPVRHVFAFGHEPLFHSFKLKIFPCDRSLKVVSTFDRLFKEESLNLLRTMGDLVDRELWGICYAAQERKIDCFSYKIVSDVAGTIGACELVRKNADEFSQSLFDFFQNSPHAKNNEIEKLKATSVEMPLFDSSFFYFTVSQRRLIKNLYDKLLFYFEKETLDKLIKAKNEKYAEIKKPKDRTKLLANDLRQLLCPHHEMEEGSHV